MPPKKDVTSKQRLTLSQLASYDDILTDALVDHVYYWSTIRKNRLKYSQTRGISEDDITQILLHRIIIDKDAAAAEAEFLKLSGLRKFHDRLRTSKERDDFRKHLRKYICMWLPDCAFEITTTNRYTITTHEAAVRARREIRKGEVIRHLCGTLVPITPEEESDLDLTRRDFSIVMSSRKKTPSMFLGPARFANHDCNANAGLSTVGVDGMQVVATRLIERDEEITVTYGEDYFGPGNRECLCGSCEAECRNGWTPPAGESRESARESMTPQPANGYNFRRKRTLGSSGLSTPSMTPDPEESRLKCARRSKMAADTDRLATFAASPLSNAVTESDITTESLGRRESALAPIKSSLAVEYTPTAPSTPNGDFKSETMERSAFAMNTLQTPHVPTDSAATPIAPTKRKLDHEAFEPEPGEIKRRSPKRRRLSSSTSSMQPLFSQAQLDREQRPARSASEPPEEKSKLRHGLMSDRIGHRNPAILQSPKEKLLPPASHLRPLQTIGSTPSQNSMAESDVDSIFEVDLIKTLDTPVSTPVDTTPSSWERRGSSSSVVSTGAKVQTSKSTEGCEAGSETPASVIENPETPVFAVETLEPLADAVETRASFPSFDDEGSNRTMAKDKFEEPSTLAVYTLAKYPAAALETSTGSPSLPAVAPPEPLVPAVADLPTTDDSDDELSALSANEDFDDANGCIVRKAIPPARRGRGRPKKIRPSDAAVPSVETAPAPSAAIPKAAALPPSPTAARRRHPGDHMRPAALLAEPYARYVDCKTCAARWVQPDGYCTRRECPRCERHSKLYGFRWPRTERARGGAERVMDHRIVHRFLGPEEEREVRRRGRGLY